MYIYHIHLHIPPLILMPLHLSSILTSLVKLI